MTFVYIIYIFYVDMIYQKQWIPLQTRNTGGCSLKDIETASSSNISKNKDRRRLRKKYKREERAALRDLASILRRGQV